MIVTPRSENELKLMRKSGQITAKALKRVLSEIKPGVNLLHLEAVAVEEITKNGGKLSFPTVEGYRWATCLTVNDELVHGIPRDIQLKDGDIVSVDIGAMYKGWHTDAAWSVLVGSEVGGRGSERKKFLAVGEETLWKAIKQAVTGNKIGDISEVIQTGVEEAGYSVSETLVGHGVGRELHEDPNVPGLGRKGTGPELRENMTIAVEVIYAEGDAETELATDGWTYITRDGSLGGLFEMSLIVKKGKAEVLTDWRKV
jgi:methionyl aminopeptidase